MTRVSRTIWILFLLFFSGAVGVTLFGEKGLRELRGLTADHQRLEDENRRLIQENRDLYREVDRLNHDRKYIEAIARQELGLIGENEIILRSQ
jgi:cell division protein FtsB